MKTECDSEGLRKIIMMEYSGNAVTNGSLHISITPCRNSKQKKPEPIFIVDAPNISPSDVRFEWKSLDSVTIIFDKRLRIFKQEMESKSIQPKIVFSYKKQ